VGTNLREHFDRAVSGDPGADLGEMAHAAIAQGGRVRLRRKQMAVAGVAAGVAMVLAVVAGVNHRSPVTGPANPAALAPAAVGPAMMLVAAAGCSPEEVMSDATDAVVRPGDADGHVTGEQLSALRSVLEHDARVRTVVFESHEQAYQRFRELWAEYPDFIASVGPDSLSESFGVRLADPSQYSAFRADYEAMDTVTGVYGRICPVTAPVGGNE
jgi:hypothetical protein